MRIAYIADGRAEHTRRWLRYFTEIGDQVLLLSTYPCGDSLPGVDVRVLPRVFSPGNALVKRSDTVSSTGREGLQLRLMRSGVYWRIWSAWHQATLLEVPLQARAARRALDDFQPDLVHATRVQNEGYVAALAGWHPWLLSIWGQDFVFFAERSPIQNALTRWAVGKPDGLAADCLRDIRLAGKLGFPENRPARYFPGNGGVDLDIFGPGPDARHREPLVLYPRGLAPYLRITTLLKAIRLVAAGHRQQRARFLLLSPPAVVPILEAMAAEERVPDEMVEVSAFRSREGLADLLQSSAVFVSPSVSDGIPNSMLEAMACGAFPVVGDIESMREWVEHGVNGLLFDPEDPKALATCLVEALGNWRLRQQAQEINLALVKDRANYSTVMPQVREYYGLIAGKATVGGISRQT